MPVAQGGRWSGRQKATPNPSGRWNTRRYGVACDRRSWSWNGNSLICLSGSGRVVGLAPSDKEFWSTGKLG